MQHIEISHFALNIIEAYMDIFKPLISQIKKGFDKFINMGKLYGENWEFHAKRIYIWVLKNGLSG
jgi:hypothetical protein